MPVKEILKDADTRMGKAVDAVTREFHEVHTGRANPALIEEMIIPYYGTPTPIKQIASVSVPDPRTIVIQPWDKNALEDLDKGLQASNLGITPNNDGNLVRLTIPALTQERRQELSKVVKDMAEKGRVALRNIRREANEKIKKLKTDSAINEDDSFKGQEDVQKLTDKFIKEVDKVLEHKTHELMDI